MARRTPHEPVFRRPKITGVIPVGNTPVEPLAPTLTLLGTLDIGVGGTGYCTLMGDSERVVVHTDGAFRLIDISDPTAPTEVASLAITGGQANSDVCWFSGNYFAAFGPTDGPDEVAVYSAVPGTIALVGTVVDPTAPPFSMIDSIQRIERVSATVIAVGGYALGMIDVSDPANPAILGGITQDDLGGDPIYELSIERDRDLLTYLTDSATSYSFTVDISDPSTPTYTGDNINNNPPHNAATDVLITGNYQYTTQGAATFGYVNATTPGSFSSTSTVTTTGAHAELERLGSAAVVTLGRVSSVPRVSVLALPVATVALTEDLSGTIEVDIDADVTVGSLGDIIVATTTDPFTTYLSVLRVDGLANL